MIDLVINIAILIVSSITLVKSATILVQSISTISARFKITEFTAAFILMAFITSIPEIAVSVNSSLMGNSVLALGTAIGSTITDLTLIIAIPTLVVGGIKIESIIARKDTFFMLLFALIPVITLIDGSISRTDGLILLIFYLLYIYRLASQRKHFPEEEIRTTKKEAARQTISFVFAVILLFIASRLLVFSATNIADLLSISPLLVGLVLISAGTSLPELAYELRAITLKKDQQVLGDILGSVVANSTIVLAVAALIQPIDVGSFSTIITPVIFLVLVLIYFVFAVYTDHELKIREVLILISIYFIYILTEFGLELIHIAPEI